jgi:hypothetical protein
LETPRQILDIDVAVSLDHLACRRRCDSGAEEVNIDPFP